MSEENYNKIKEGLDEFRLTLIKLEEKIENGINEDLLLDSYVIGIMDAGIKNNINQANLTDEERLTLSDDFDNLKDFNSDLQIKFEMYYKLIKRTEEEQHNYLDYKMNEIHKERSDEENILMYEIAANQLIKHQEQSKYI